MEAIEFRRVLCPVCRSLIFEASLDWRGQIRIKCGTCTRRFRQPVLVTIETFTLALAPSGAVDSAPTDNLTATPP
jgi:hypothetical protein